MAEQKTHIQLPHIILDEVQLRRVLDRILELLDAVYNERGDEQFLRGDAEELPDVEKTINEVLGDLALIYVKKDSSNLDKRLNLNGDEFLLKSDKETMRFVALDSSNLLLGLEYQDYDTVKTRLEAVGLSLSDILTREEMIIASSGIDVKDMTLIYRKYADERYIMLDSSNLNGKLTYQSTVSITDDNDLATKKYVDSIIEVQATPTPLDSTATLADVIDKVNDIITILQDSKITE